MRKLSIILSGLIGIILLVTVFVPLGMGFWVQKKYPDMLSIVANNPYMSAKIVKFNRGWFHSKAILQINIYSTLVSANGEAAILSQFNIQQKILHGPIIFIKSMSGSRRLVLARAALQNQSQDENLNFRANTLWTMANGLRTQLAVKHILLSNELQRIEINQLNGKIKFTPNNHHLQASLSLGDAAVYASNPEKVQNNLIDLIKILEGQGLRIKMDIHVINNLWYGNRLFTARKIIIYPYTGTAFSADNWHAEMNQSQQNGLTNIKFVNYVDHILDKQLKIDQLKVILELSNMNSKVLENFVQVFMAGSDLQRLKLYPLLINLLSKGMSVDLRQLQFNTDEGLVSLQAQIFSPNTDDTEFGLMHLLENIRMKATAQMPKVWLGNNLTSYYQEKQRANPNLKIDPQLVAHHYLDYWINHHLLVLQDQQLTMGVDYSNGKLLINGEKPSLSNFISDESLSDIHG